MKQKSNLKLAWGLFGTHVGGVILCAIVTFALITFVEARPLQVLTGCLSILIYAMLIFGSTWKMGYDDLNRVKFNRRQEDKIRGLKIGLLTTVPMFVLAIALLLAKAELLPNFYIIYKVVNAHTLVFIDLIDHTFDGVQSAYLPNVSWGQIIAVCSLTLITPIVSEIGYLLGYKEIMVMDKIMYKKQGEKKKSS